MEDHSLEELKKKLEAARPPKETSSPEEESMSPLRVGAELVSGVITGMLVGYFLDKWLNTKPFLFLVCFFLGAIAGGLNIYKAATKDSKK